MWKVFDANAWSALLSNLSWVHQTADRNASAVSGLGTDLAALSQTANAAIQNLDAAKQDKRQGMEITLPASGWVKDGAAAYPYSYELSVPGVTDRDRAEVTIAPGSIETAAECGLCPTNETLEGTVRLWARSVPSAAIRAEYWLEKGAQS